MEPPVPKAEEEQVKAPSENYLIEYKRDPRFEHLLQEATEAALGKIAGSIKDELGGGIDAEDRAVATCRLGPDSDVVLTNVVVELPPLGAGAA